MLGPDAMDKTERERILAALEKGRGLVKRAKDARGRAYRHTGGTATFEREWAKADRFEEQADEQFDAAKALLEADVGP